LLTSELTLEISGLQRKRYPFSWCTSVGCLARIAITPDELSALMSETLATITIVSIKTPTTRMNLPVSLLGFTAAFNAMQAANNPS
jgi:invasion protein IalB